MLKGDYTLRSTPLLYHIRKVMKVTGVAAKDPCVPALVSENDRQRSLGWSAKLLGLKWNNTFQWRWVHGYDLETNVHSNFGISCIGNYLRLEFMKMLKPKLWLKSDFYRITKLSSSVTNQSIIRFVLHHSTTVLMAQKFTKFTNLGSYI